MSPTPPVSSSTPTTGSNASTAAASSDSTVNENMFLQLLVAQIQNQDPSNPTDGTQFITELAQFQQVQQSVNDGQTLSSILTDANQISDSLTGTNASSTS
jgi:flagellar basal-body rod modification protein FlgD